MPQGSVVGPLFFIIFINDLPDNITKSSCYLFADDSKLLSRSIPDLQHDIVNFQIWATENLMYFNIDKCKSLYFDGRNKSRATVTLDGNEIPIANCIKDLGIHVQSSISWKSHIQEKLVAARKSFQFLKRTIPHNVSVATKLLYYRLCVHSILLYGSQIWYSSISQRRQLELFNRKCLYWVTGLWDYNLQLSRTRTLPISFYLVLQDLIFLNKSIKGKYDLNIQNFICFSSNVRNLQTSHCQLLTPVSKCNKFTSRQS